MQVTTQQYRRCDVVKPSGRLDSASAPQLQEILDAIADEGDFNVVVDMSDLEFISSAGLRVLINARKKCRRYNRGDLRLASVGPNIERTLELAGFQTLFHLYDTTVDAVGSF